KLLNLLVSFGAPDGAMRNDAIEPSAQSPLSVAGPLRPKCGRRRDDDGLEPFASFRARRKVREPRFACVHHASLSAGMTSRANRSTVRRTSASVRSPKAN